jgi:sugar-specific transcriptional regulator TrmB
MEIPYILRQLGFNDNEIRVYLALLSCGTCSARRLAKDVELTKHTLNEVLKALQDAGLIGTFQKHKKQLFVAESPEKLLELAERRERGMADIKRRVNELLPELKSIYAYGGAKPTVKYYEGMKGTEIILKDVLTTMSELSGDKVYRVFASPRLRQFIYNNFPNFTKERIAREIRVRVLVLGEERPDRPLMEQKTIPVRDGAPTYCFIYGPKVAFVSLDDSDSPTGVILEDARVAGTQRIVFDHIWNSSAEKRRIPVVATIAENL